MANINFTTNSISFNDVNLGGGLNTAGGPLSLRNDESPDLQNIDFNKFGSALQRNGYDTLNSTVATLSTGSITVFADGGNSDTQVTSASHGLSNGDIIQISGTTSYNGIFVINTVTTNTFVIETAFVADDATGTWYESAQSDGTHWFEFDSSGTQTQIAVNVCGGRFFKMDGLDGTWDDATNGQTITAGNHCDFENFLNTLFITNGANAPLSWDGAGTSSLTTMSVPTGLTSARYVKKYNNYLFLANVVVSGTYYKNRIYYSAVGDVSSWSAIDFIDIGEDDGEEITGMRVLSDRLVIFKTRSIYIVKFTGDADIPFILPGGGKTNSSVGCVAPFSVQYVNNVIVFLSYDGFYFFDGNNSYKISDKISPTIQNLNTKSFSIARSLVQRGKNRYMCALPSSGASENDRVLVWDFFRNAWSLYTGIAASSMSTFFVNSVSERIYFGDYYGFVYQMDNGVNDNPLGVETAIDAYYVTNWRSYSDLVIQKSVPNVVIYYQTYSTVLTFSYTYDFEDGDQRSLSVDLSTSGDVYGTALWDEAEYANEGGRQQRLDLQGRGRVVRYKFANNRLDEKFQIDGIGQFVYGNTNV